MRNIFHLIRKEIIFLIISIILIILVLVTSLLVSSRKSQEPSPVPIASVNRTSLPVINSNTGNVSSSLSVSSITPTGNTPLIPGQKQTFRINLNKASTENQLKIDLKKDNYSKDSPIQDIEVETSLENAGKILVVTTKEPIESYSQYTLKLLSSSSTPLFTQVYTSDKPQPSPIQNNNPSLIPFLPHDTPSYTLYYQKAYNSYTFSFKYDDTSSDTLQVQYEKAKQQAIDFIKSKGINPDSLTIDWRYH